MKSIYFLFSSFPFHYVRDYSIWKYLLFTEVSVMTRTVTTLLRPLTQRSTSEKLICSAGISSLYKNWCDVVYIFSGMHPEVWRRARNQTREREVRKSTSVLYALRLYGPRPPSDRYRIPGIRPGVANIRLTFSFNHREMYHALVLLTN